MPALEPVQPLPPEDGLDCAVVMPATGPPMLVKRVQLASTTANLTAIQMLIENPNCLEVRLFASPFVRTVDTTDSDGPDASWPLLAAVARYEIPGVAEVHALFDGLVATAAHRSRYVEVRDFLDVAETSSKVTFSETRAPFTSAHEPKVAIERLFGLGPVTALTPATRARYFALLSKLTEDEYL